MVMVMKQVKCSRPSACTQFPHDMKIIANENVSGSVIMQLRAHGHDILSVKETMRSATNANVLDVAQR